MFQLSELLLLRKGFLFRIGQPSQYVNKNINPSGLITSCPNRRFTSDLNCRIISKDFLSPEKFPLCCLLLPVLWSSSQRYWLVAPGPFAPFAMPVKGSGEVINCVYCNCVWRVGRTQSHWRHVYWWELWGIAKHASFNPPPRAPPTTNSCSED